MEFKKILEKNRVNVTIRREMGADINAACGQLRRKKLQSRLVKENEYAIRRGFTYSKVRTENQDRISFMTSLLGT